jgi:hypothetical protein
MHDLGFRGQNMTIAVIDAGFLQADVNPVFDSLRNEGRILGVIMWKEILLYMKTIRMAPWCFQL